MTDDDSWDQGAYWNGITAYVEQRDRIGSVQKWRVPELDLHGSPTCRRSRRCTPRETR